MNDRAMVISWLNRGTLHLVGADDYWWLHPLTTPQLEVGNRRRLQQEGVSPAQADRGVDVVTEAVVSRGPQTRRRTTRASRCGRRSDREAGPRARADGRVVAQSRGARPDARQRARVRRGVASGWAIHPTRCRDAVALARLARRVPRGPRSGRRARSREVGRADARRRAYRARGNRVASSPIDREAWSISRAARYRAAKPKPRLLGPFDPLLLGWVSRDAVVGEHRQIVTIERAVPCLRARRRPRRCHLGVERHDVDRDACSRR